MAPATQGSVLYEFVVEPAARRLRLRGQPVGGTVVGLLGQCFDCRRDLFRCQVGKAASSGSDQTFVAQQGLGDVAVEAGVDLLVDQPGYCGQSHGMVLSDTSGRSTD